MELLIERPKRQLTVPLFGRMLFLAWSEQIGTKDLPTWSELNALLLEDTSDAPSEVLDVMHLDSKSSEPVIKEMTDYVLAAQKAGLITRDNPTYIAGSIQVGSFDAARILEDHATDLPGVVAWLRKRVSSHKSAD